MLNPVTLAIVPENDDQSAWKWKLSDTKVPWLIGFTSGEGQFDVASKFGKQRFYNILWVKNCSVSD